MWYIFSKRGGAPLLPLLLPLLLLLLAPQAAAQAPLYLVDEETTVREISFKFFGSRTFEESQLLEQIVTSEPSFWDKVKRILPLVSAERYPFNPVVLQKDVVRLRNFYNRHGFLHPEITYAASQLDTTRNSIHVIFAVQEGPPLIIQDVGFFGPDGRYAYYQFPDLAQERWTEFRDAITVHTGERYTTFDRVRIVDRALGWLKNRGYAFALVEAEVDIDSTANTVDLDFIIDPGPVAYFSEIEVEGNELVEESVILRELPFRVGDRFSFSKLLRGQRELFSLNLFRVALIDVPQGQPRDSTVSVLVRVREARPRYVTAQSGYSRTDGTTVQGEWRHRNFLGEARLLTVSAVANTGVGAIPPGGVLPGRLFRGAVSLRQPYLFTTRLSGIFSPFAQVKRDPLLTQGRGFLNINTIEYGVNTTLLYEFYPFRTLAFQHTFIRSELTDVVEEDLPATVDYFNRNVFSLNGIFGKVDDYINPRRGFLLRPFAEYGAPFFGSENDIQYLKSGTEVTGYLPLDERFSIYLPPGDLLGLAGRFFIGRILPFGFSRAALLGEVPREDSLRYENRFDPVLFYIGGGDLRGWADRLGGEQTPQRVFLGRNEEGAPLYRYYYEPLGGLAELGANVELRFPFPGLGSSWGGAAFFDTGLVDDTFDLSSLKYGTGVGIRYRTLVGFIRLDIGYKINPTFEDLRDPEEVYRYLHGLTEEPPDPSWRRRFNLHFSIGQAF